MDIGYNISEIRKKLPSTVKLVAVSKFKPSEDILEAYKAGQRAFAESRPQELATKASELPHDIEWHFIGHLQTNKIKLVLPHVTLIHSIDSRHLLEEVSRQASASGKTIDCLLEVHIASEDAKQGFSAEEAFETASSAYSGIRLRGLMGMATFTEDKILVRDEFHKLKQTFDRIKDSLDKDLSESFDTVSMGMSGDYLTAIEEGTTLVRIGSAIFGSRNKTEI